MITARIRSERAVPLWAVLGAPLVGVPLMVVLLALTAPAQEMPADDVEGFATEQVEVQGIEQAVRGTAGCLIQPLQNG